MLSPTVMAPLSGVSCLVIIRNKVVLPAPFGPIKPTLSPRRIVALKSLTISLSPEGVGKLMQTSLSSATILPLAGGFVVQTGAFKDRKSAEALQRSLTDNGYDTSITN